MALDEPKDNDLVVEQEGLSFVVDKKLVNYLPAVTIGYRKGWFGSGLFVEAGSFGC